MKSILLFATVAILLSFLIRQTRTGIPSFFKSIFSVNSGYSTKSSDAKESRFRILLVLTAILVSSLFISLGLSQIIYGAPDQNGIRHLWTPTVLRNIPASVFAISAACMLTYIGCKSLAIRLYSAVHFSREHSGTIITHFLNCLVVDSLLSLPVIIFNEFYPLDGQVVLLVSCCVWGLTKVVNALHVYMFFSSEGIGFFQFLLYFCGLEIMPLPVFCKCMFLLSYIVEP